MNEADFEAEERRMRQSTWDRKPKASRWSRTSSTQRGNYTVPREEGDEDAAVALARSFLEAVTTREKKETGPRRSGKDKEEQNIRTWPLNPRNPAFIGFFFYSLARKVLVNEYLSRKSYNEYWKSEYF